MKTKKVNKNKYEVIEAMGGYYYIAPIGSNCPVCDTTVWGGDSAWEDNYDKELVSEIYDNWNGDLIKENDFDKWHIAI